MSKLLKYQKGADAGDNEFTSFVNYMVTKRVEGKYRLRRILMILAYVVVGIAYALVFTVGIKLPMLITFLPLLIWFIVYCTWMYVSIEYEYTIVGGLLRGMEVYGMRKFRELFSVRISSMTLIAPYSGDFKKEADDARIVNRYHCVSSMSSPDVWFGIYKNEAGESCVVFFEMVEKTLKCVRYYNSVAVKEAAKL